MRRLLTFVSAVSVAAPSLLAQQLPGLKFDGVTAFYRVGRISMEGPWQRDRVSPCPSGSFPTCGWGFEAVYHMTESTADIGHVNPDEKERKWGTEIAVGYDFLNFHGRRVRDSDYELFGSLQTLPSFTLYASREFDPIAIRHLFNKKPWAIPRMAWYVGLGTGIVALKNVHAYDKDGHIYNISVDNAWSFTPSIGLSYDARFADERGAGSSFFIEYSYEFQNFPLGYSLPGDPKILPDNLPRRLSANGPVISIGLEIRFKKEPVKTAVRAVSETPLPP